MKKTVKGRRASDKAEDRIILEINGFWEWMGYVIKYRLKALIILILALVIGIAIVLNLSFVVKTDKGSYIKWDKAADIDIKR